MTFDWAQIAYIGSPLLTPWWAAANVVGGLVIVMWVLAPILCKPPPISMKPRAIPKILSLLTIGRL